MSGFTPRARKPEGPPPPSRCPLLGTEGRTGAQSDPVEHPSFENRCWAGDRPASLLLTDQATLCLCSGFRHCPRFVAARAARRAPEMPANVPYRSNPTPAAATSTHRNSPTSSSPISDSTPTADALAGDLNDDLPDDPLSHALNELEAEYDAAEKAQTRSRRRWGWIGAGLIFVSSLLCGGLFAAYIGWQMVRTDILATQPGSVDTLAAAPVTQPQLYLIVTATSEPAAADPSTGASASDPLIGPTPIFPMAVTPTPGGVATTSLNPNTAPSGIALAAEAEQQAQNEPDPLPQAVPQQQGQPAVQQPPATSPVDIQLQIPTRRPTPILDIPTSTPAPDEATATPTHSPTPLPPLGTPFVLFSARDKTLQPGECTIVSWHVENVRAVYYENLGVDGRGEHEECVRNDPGDYNLLVVLADGSTRIYTATVDLVIPTDTPQPTPTFTIPPEPTPTWTPNVPTDTPVPPMQWGVRLEASGKTNLTCSRGETCQLDLYVTNTATAVDSLYVGFTEAGAWPHHLCRMDGVCSDNGMTLVNVSPSNTGVIQFKVEVPAEPDFNEMTYRLRAASENSGGSVTSETVTIHITTE